MRGIARFMIETVLLMLLAGGMLIIAILVTRQIFSDEKIQYFTIGYYLAIHNDLVKGIWKRSGAETWIGKKLGGEKAVE
jgi:hypothetical protein